MSHLRVQLKVKTPLSPSFAGTSTAGTGILTVQRVWSHWAPSAKGPRLSSTADDEPRALFVAPIPARYGADRFAVVARGRHSNHNPAEQLMVRPTPPEPVRFVARSFTLSRSRILTAADP